VTDPPVIRIGGPGGPELELGGGRTRLMGVVNVTSDSFQAVGRHLGPATAVRHGLALAEAGAEILDVGGESTRPGHQRVPAEAQIQRVVPVIRELAARVAVPISIDTTLAPVAEAALDAGAAWINDTAALHQDPALATLAAERRCPLVLMHRFEPARNPGDAPPAGRALVRAIAAALEERIRYAVARGVDRSRIVLDPGIGFGTLPDDNLSMHAFVDELRAPGRPLLFGTSRKSFLGHVTGRAPEERLWATAGSVAWLAMQGVEIVRVHDVAEMSDVIRVLDAIRAVARREEVTDS
jgi:dihydropteroate synthase